MKSFSIRPDGFNEIKKKMLIRTSLLSFFSAAVGIGVAVTNDNGSYSFSFLPYYVLFLLAYFAFRTNRRLKKMKATFNSYRLTISDDGVITREQLSLSPVSVTTIEISAISKYKNGIFSITGLTKADVIYVPAQIENAELLEAELNKLHPVSVLTSMPLKQKLSMVFAITTIICLLGIFISSNKLVVAVCGILLTGMLLYIFTDMRKNKNIPEQFRRKSWLYLIIFLVVLLNILVKVFDIHLENLFQ